jgi:hypothetical protein
MGILKQKPEGLGAPICAECGNEMGWMTPKIQPDNAIAVVFGTPLEF